MLYPFRYFLYIVPVLFLKSLFWKKKSRQKTTKMLPSRAERGEWLPLLEVTHQKPPNGGVGFGKIIPSPHPPLLLHWLQNAITFFYWITIEFRNVCKTKVFTCSVFLKKFWFVSHHFCLVFYQKILFLA